ncbi:hypothetical protein V8C37DRAFT_387862 [Trichoderma ceciliae]
MTRNKKRKTKQTMSSLECTCGRPFGSEQALRDHRKSVAQYICGLCNKCLLRSSSLREHRASSVPACGQKRLDDGSWRCNDCRAQFNSQAALRSHLQSTGHAVEFRCCDCNKSFQTANALNAHLKNKTHATPVAEPKTKPLRPRCKDCDRTFNSDHSLRQHLKSTIHCPISDLTCMAGKICGCDARFRSPSAMVAHMESGSCRSGMDRQKLNRLILVQDCDNVITNSSGIFEYTGWAKLENGEESTSCSGVMTPSTDSEETVILTPSDSQLSLASIVERRLVGRASSRRESDCTELSEPKFLFCPLCPNTKRPFSTRTGLEHHMRSPAHTPKMFHCPSILYEGISGKAKPKMKQFSTVSGLVAHIESGACRGKKAGLRTVMEYMEERLDEMGISFKLLGI